MKSRTLMLVVALACIPALDLLGQINCTPNPPVHLVCAYPFSGATLSQYTFGAVDSATKAYQAALNAAVPINAAIATQLTQLPVPSASVGVISLKKKGSEVPVPYDNLGPLLIDRPDTWFKGHLFLGFNYQHFNFNNLDGFGFSNLPIGYTFATNPNNDTSIPPTYFYGQSSNKVSFKLDQYASVAVFGATRFTDLSIIIPANSVSVSATSSKFSAIEYDAAKNQYSVHSPAAGTTSTSSGSSSGIGDIIIGIKQMLLGQDRNRPAAAIGATFRFPSGDSMNYLGSGALGGSAFGLAEYRAKFTPHVKIAYQWNLDSKLMQTQNSGKVRLPGGLMVAAGVDVRVHRTLTLAGDILSNTIINAPYLIATTNNFNPVPPSVTGISPPTYTVVSTQPRSYTPVHFSGGAKFSPIPHLVVYGNALIQMNDVGLKSDVVPLIGIAYNWHVTNK